MIKLVWKDMSAECETVEEAAALVKALGGAVEDSGGWIEYDGLGMPVPGDTSVQILFRCETKDDYDSHVNAAGTYEWDVSGGRYDIVAYRIVK